MCFSTRPSVSVAKTATKNILAYKLLKDISPTGGSSPFHDLKWEVGKPVKAPLKTKLDYSCQSINEGLHCFKTKRGAMNYLYKRDGHKLVPVLIPKGSKYYENNTQIVSNQMILLSNDAGSFAKVAKLIGAKKI